MLPSAICEYDKNRSPLGALEYMLEIGTSRFIFCRALHRFGWPCVERAPGCVAVPPFRKCGRGCLRVMYGGESCIPRGDSYTMIYYALLYYTVLYCIIQYYTVLYYTILYYTILYYTILYYTILYYTILYYTILYDNIILCYSIRQYYYITLYCDIMR